MKTEETSWFILWMWGLAISGTVGALMHEVNKYADQQTEVVQELSGTVEEVQYVPNGNRPYTVVTMCDGRAARLKGIQAIDKGRQVVLRITRAGDLKR